MITVEQEDIEKVINSSDELDFLLKKYKLKKYIDYQESFDLLYEKFPFMKNFEYGINTRNSFSSIKMNEYLGYALIPYAGLFSSFIVNIFLNAYFKKRRKK
jgi:hypothetical protein